MKALVIAANTFRECVRDKVLYVLVAFAAAAILGSKALGWISIGQDIKIIKDISLAAISLFGVLIAVFVGTNLVYKELDKRTIYTILCRPIRRYEFLLGKYLGLAGLLFVITAIMTGISTLYILAMGGSVDLTFLQAALLTYCELLLLTALSILLSCAASPILSALIVVCAYFAGHAAEILRDLPAPIEESPAAIVLKTLYFIIPNLETFNLRPEAANMIEVRPEYVLWAVAYCVIYTSMLLALAAIAFEDKDV